LQAIRYIFFETLPAFLMGAAVFTVILLMFQALRLTDFLLGHGGSLGAVGRIMLYMSISFLPIILPMSLLFSVLLTYNRLSNDSEIVALKSLGLSMLQLTIPAVVLGIMATLMSAQTSFYLGPWGNRKFELLFHELGRQKVAATIREGVFSEGFFDLVIYANKVDSKSGMLQDVFIYNEQDRKSPVTIIAKKGSLIQEMTASGQSATLRLTNGNIHRTNQNTYTKVDFDLYDINLFDPVQNSEKKKSPQSMTIDEISDRIAKDKTLEAGDRKRLEVEYHTRWSLSSTCMIFALLGVGLGTVTNRRTSRGGGFVLCLVTIIAYWGAYVTVANLAQRGWMPAYLGLWGLNALFLFFGLLTLRRSWN
jgi:lipopolysaccharide export system permease protein